MYWCNGKGLLRCVLCREVVPFSEGPLSEVPLHCMHTSDLMGPFLSAIVTAGVFMGHDHNCV